MKPENFNLTQENVYGDYALLEKALQQLPNGCVSLAEASPLEATVIGTRVEIAPRTGEAVWHVKKTLFGYDWDRTEFPEKRVEFRGYGYVYVFHYKPFEAGKAEANRNKIENEAVFLSSVLEAESELAEESIK